jgi:hypothetical protein
LGKIVNSRFDILSKDGIFTGFLVVSDGIVDLVYLVLPFLDTVLVCFLFVLLFADLLLDKDFLLF